MRKIIVTSLFITSSLTFANQIEVTCKSKAKEIAAETYKNCLTESKQVEIERIRSEYQSQLSDLKSKYNSQLQKISNKSKSAEKTPTKSTILEKKTIETTEMPSEKARKVIRQEIKTERIDLSETPLIEKASPESEVASHMNDEPTVKLSVPSPEIVEIPVQSE